jgi:hypothetical protein
MGLEYAIEQGLKTALLAVTDALDIAANQVPVYRTFFGDDDENEETEKRVIPCVSIQADPNVPDGYQSIFHDTKVRIEIATYDAPEHDPKGAVMKAIYEAIRAVLDADSWTLTGYAKKSTVIEGGSSEFDGPFRLVGMDLKVNSCA